MFSFKSPKRFSVMTSINWMKKRKTIATIIITIDKFYAASFHFTHFHIFASILVFNSTSFNLLFQCLPSKATKKDLIIALFIIIRIYKINSMTIEENPNIFFIECNLVNGYIKLHSRLLIVTIFSSSNAY